jgi:site-specific DNA-methyltransferase (adenine-specific)
LGGGQFNGHLSLLRGDSIKLLADNARFASASVDLILTDPPWNITECVWERPLDLAAMFAGFTRVLKKNGVLLIFSQLPFTISLANAAKTAGIPLRYEWVWDKRKVTGYLNANRIPLRRHESILVFYRALPTYNPQGLIDSVPKRRSSDSAVYHRVRAGAQGSKSRFPTSILPYPPAHGAKACQKPVELLEYLIRTYTHEGETVLDAFLGTGQTAVAAYAAGRRFIGIEINRERFDAAWDLAADARKVAA